MRGVLLEGEGLNKHGGSVWIGRGGGYYCCLFLGRWKEGVKEYMCERGATRRRGFEQARGGVFG